MLPTVFALFSPWLAGLSLQRLSLPGLSTLSFSLFFPSDEDPSVGRQENLSAGNYHPFLSFRFPCCGQFACLGNGILHCFSQSDQPGPEGIHKHFSSYINLQIIKKIAANQRKRYRYCLLMLRISGFRPDPCCGTGAGLLFLEPEFNFTIFDHLQTFIKLMRPRTKTEPKVGAAYISF